MPSSQPPLVACLDANVLISAVAFGGNPGQILRRLVAEEFINITSPNILDEVRRNLTGKKLRMSEFLADAFLEDIQENSS